MSEEEWRALPAATLTIALELAARFAADALQESYFGWNAARFGSVSEHNQVRAAGQLRLAESVGNVHTALESAVSNTIGESRQEPAP